MNGALKKIKFMWCCTLGSNSSANHNATVLFCVFHLQLGGVTIQLNQLSILLSVCCPAERHNDAMHCEHVFE